MFKKIKNSILLKTINVAYKKGRADGFYECRNNGYEVAFANGLKQGRVEMLDEVIKKLSESEETILSDKQYYTLMELKEQKNG